MNNFNVLFILKILKNILWNFSDSFFILYFLGISYNNILSLGIYKLISITVLYITIFLFRNISKSKYRIHLLRIGIFFEFVYFFLIFMLKEKLIDNIILLGIIYGIAEGLYFSVYDVIESYGVNNTSRNKFSGYYIVIKSIISILFPLIFGGLISIEGFSKCIFLVLIIVVLMIIMSFIFKDIYFYEDKKVNLNKYVELINDNNIPINRIYKIYIFYGFTYSLGAFSNIVTLYIIKIFNDSFSLGIFTSIFSIISCIIGLLFSKLISKHNNIKYISISMSFTIITLVLMVFSCNFVTVVIFNFFQTISKTLLSLINDNTVANISNYKLVKQKYKIEYFLGCETALFIGRVISYCIFITMSFFYDYMIIFIMVFIIFLIILTFESIKLQKDYNGIDIDN